MRLSLACAIASVALGGCASLGGSAVSTSPSGTASPSTSTTTTSKLAIAQSTHEYPSPAPPGQRVGAGAANAIAAVRAFAEQYINWTAQTVSAHMRTLAAASVGQARSAMQLAAAQTGSDYELQRGGVANSGSVEAIAPLAGPRDEYVVVTRELTTATNTTAYQGLRPAWHVAIATLTQVSPGVWALSGWQPES